LVVRQMNQSAASPDREIAPGPWEPSRFVGINGPKPTQLV
jgi:hypothetical protein